jgi:glycosyltransferase involved in cell wall biosynthesis
MYDIIFTVSNDLSYDQRMMRISTSLAQSGYKVLLVGRRKKKSIPLVPQPFQQKRLKIFFSKGKLFYIEFNIRLMAYLLTMRCKAICAIDLDTIMPCLFISLLKGSKRAYDAHELFCEMKEIVTRPAIYKFWKKIERFTVPKFTNGYTVSDPIADEFKKMYGVNYRVIINCPRLMRLSIPEKNEKYVLYQGAVNEGRSFESLIPAMKDVDARLIICGDGNYMQQAMHLVKQHGLEQRVIFKGLLPPAELREVSLRAWIGITLFEKNGLSNYYSSANRFFDYIHAGLPQLCVDYPVYHEINKQCEVAVLINDLSSSCIARELNRLLHNQELYDLLQQNCIKARDEFNWDKEEKKLIAFYQNLLP